MTQDEVRKPGDAIAYLTDCALATLVEMHHKKRTPKHEYERHIVIAQLGVEWCKLFCAAYHTTRVAAVIAHRSNVRLWLESGEAA